MGQIPRSTERISSIVIKCVVLVPNCFFIGPKLKIKHYNSAAGNITS